MFTYRFEHPLPSGADKARSETERAFDILFVMEKRYPKFVVGAFILNDKGQLFLRTTPSQDNKFTCINQKRCFKIV